MWNSIKFDNVNWIFFIPFFSFDFCIMAIRCSMVGIFICGTIYYSYYILTMQNLPTLKSLKEKRKEKIEYSFQEAGIELQQYFKVKWVWRLFYKYKESNIREALRICKEKGVTNPNYLIGILKNMNYNPTGCGNCDVC